MNIRMGLEDLKAKYEEEKDERKRRKISEMMLGESRGMCRLDLRPTFVLLLKTNLLQPAKLKKFKIKPRTDSGPEVIQIRR